MPDSGTSFTWASRAFGPWIGWMAGWGLVSATILVLSNLAGIAVEFLFLLIAQLTEAIARALFAAARGCGALLRTGGYLLKWPVAALWERTTEPAWEALMVKIERRRQREELKRLWRTEFRDQFATFREFLDAFDNGGKSTGGGQQDAPKADAKHDVFTAACRLLGLPTSGEFTLQQLNARFRALMQKAHPDSGGSNEHAARLNAARDLIKKTKGWS